MVDLTQKRKYEDMCPDCRDDRDPSDTASYCVCPPKPNLMKKITTFSDGVIRYTVLVEGLGTIRMDVTQTGDVWWAESFDYNFDAQGATEESSVRNFKVGFEEAIRLGNFDPEDRVERIKVAVPLTK